MDRLGVGRAAGTDTTEASSGGTTLAGFSLRQLKQSVRADLEDLLNSRLRCLSPPAGLDQLDHSLVNYGVPDFSGLALGSPDDRERFRQAVEGAIAKFERRLANVRLVISNPQQPEDRILRFRIEAELRTEPMPEPVVFDSVVDPGLRRIRVERST